MKIGRPLSSFNLLPIIVTARFCHGVRRAQPPERLHFVEGPLQFRARAPAALPMRALALRRVAGEQLRDAHGLLKKSSTPEANAFTASAESQAVTMIR